MAYFDQNIDSACKDLKTNIKGLSSEEAKRRLAEYGPNQIQEKGRISPVKMFIGQFNNFLIWILMAATVISAVIGEYVDALVILFIIIMNAILGFLQEYRAEKAIEALKKMASLKARVLRDRNPVQVDASELVPGDIILLETGEKIPADSRIIELLNLQTQEAALTGESLPIKKELDVLKSNAILAERKNMCFSGTVITSGRGKALVCATGMNTEIGKIAKLIQDTESEVTPIQVKLKQLSQVLGVVTIIVCAAVFLAGVLKGEAAAYMFLSAVSLAVAAIPEGLPAVVTISLALGLQKMAKKHALIRKLHSVETLGSVTVICTDKTGTLTKNEMTVQKIFANGRVIDVSGAGYMPKGDFTHVGKNISTEEIELLLIAGALNNNAILQADHTIIGDPTEGSLIVSAAKAGYHKVDLEKKHSRLHEIEFSSERKRMTTVHRMKNQTMAFCKGAPEVILGLCTKIYEDGKVRPITPKDSKQIKAMNEKFADEALRVIGFAFKEVKGDAHKMKEEDFIFLGLQGMIDPPREEVKEAIKKCKKAGIKVVMITGDFEITAKAIARALGIEGRCVTGRELDNIKDLKKTVEEISIYARVNPEHKMKVVDALQSRGHIVAMTGDGVNDAPALKSADIGIAMGITGTDVAKEASAMILTDDNFNSIVGAVETGRTIFDNIKIFIKYLLIGNAAGIMAVLISILVGLPLPLLALQILWFNLVTETIPSIALTKEPPERDVMSRKPRTAKESFLTRSEMMGIIMGGLIITVGVLGVFYFALTKGGWTFGDIIDSSSMPPYYLYATTMAFTTLVLFQLFNVFNAKSPNHTIFFEEMFNNGWLILAVFLSVTLQLAVIYTPLNVFFGTVPLTLIDWAIIIAVSSSIIVFVELEKLMMSKFRNK